MNKPPNLWAVVPFANTFDRKVNQRRASWGRLVNTLTTFRVCDSKKNVPAWSPAEYIAGKTRGSAGVRSLSCLVLDYDNGKATIKDARSAWGSWPGILHTSWSHTPEHHKFRVILPLWRPVPAEDWAGVFAWAESWTRTTDTPNKEMTQAEYERAAWIKTIDPACKDPGRIFYVPAVRDEDWPNHAEHWLPQDRPGVFLGRYEPWARHVQEHRERRARLEARRVAPPPPRRRKAAVQMRQDKEQIRTNPQRRREIGQALGGTIAGEQVRKVRCPQCGGWYGGLEQLTGESASSDRANRAGKRMAASQQPTPRS